MKAICYALCALLLFNTSCSKDTDPNADIMGKWNWVSSDGGLIGAHYTPASTGRNVVLQFTRGNNFYTYTNGTLTTQGTFTVRMIEDSGRQRRYIEFSSGMGSEIIALVTPTTLQLGENANDGFAHLYKR